LNYPNPFNASTQFTYQLPKACEVSAIIYNLLGQKIRTLISEKQEVGTYVLLWDGTDIAGTVMPSGLYILRFRADSFARIQKMMVVK
ncbi:T9SS type A sorting domain-containing protein, partial [candidate division KSB1 bacterium]|nr:T9SS type A sorting domain-containing protein [candidate division KSB1 bacterium]